MVKFNCIVLFFICPLIYFAQKVNNVEASQQGQNIVVTYDLETEQPCTINLFISTNGGTTWQGPLKQVEGQVGPNIKSGKKNITLYVLTEFNELRGDNIRFKVVAATKNLNTIKIADPVILSNKSFGGAYYAAFSLIIPGLGKAMVTGSPRGLGTLIFVIGSGAIGYNYKNKSELNYNNYMLSKNQSEMNTYYDQYKQNVQYSQVYFGAAAFFWLYDIYSTYLLGEARRDKQYTYTKNEKYKLSSSLGTPIKTVKLTININ